LTWLRGRGFGPLSPSPVYALQKTNSWYSQLPCLTFSIKGIVWWTSQHVCLLCFWASHLTGCLYLWFVKQSATGGSLTRRWKGPSLSPVRSSYWQVNEQELRINLAKLLVRLEMVFKLAFRRTDKATFSEITLSWYFFVFQFNKMLYWLIYTLIALNMSAQESSFFACCFKYSLIPGRRIKISFDRQFIISSNPWINCMFKSQICEDKS